MQMLGTELYKVGFTRGLASERLASLQTACPLPLKLRFEFDGSTALESWIHRKWRHCSSGGGAEWLKLSSDELEDVLLDLRMGMTLPMHELHSPMIFFDWLMEQRRRDDPVGDFARETYWVFSARGTKKPVAKIASIQEWADFLSDLSHKSAFAGAIALNEYLIDSRIAAAFQNTAWYARAVQALRELNPGVRGVGDDGQQARQTAEHDD